MNRDPQATATQHPTGAAAHAAMLAAYNPLRSGRFWLLYRVVPLLYTGFWFISPWYRHSVAGWLWFAVFYLLFCLAFFETFEGTGTLQRSCLGFMFLLGYLYVPFSQSAAGEFVYPVVISVFFLRQPKTEAALVRFLAIALAQSCGLLLETKLFHLNFGIAESVIFYSFAIGLSTFGFSRHILSNEQLREANSEIKHLTQIAERERIARDLHDLLGHTLTVIVLKTDIANRLFTEQPELAHREIAEVEATARKALAEVRQAVVGYRTESLPAEVSNTRHVLLSAGVQLTTTIDYLALTHPQANALCLALREAVTNVIRHANASICHIGLHRDGDRAILSIEDNGSGKLAAEGSGLQGMRERLAALGGTLRRVAVPGSGNLLTAELPLVEVAQHSNLPNDSAAQIAAFELPPQRTTRI
jgi:two-component system sensor histidine kinase DesK